MLTQGRQLDVVSHNLSNFSTAGYKSDRYTATTFDTVMYRRVGNKDRSGAEDIGEQSYIRASSQIYTDFGQGIPEQTELTLDFAIYGDGFFAVEDEEGNVAYTRSGGFSLDEEGFLCLAPFGRVLDTEGEQIQLITDKVRGDEFGIIYDEGGGALARLGVYSFEDNGALERDNLGLFQAAGQEPQLNENARLYWGYVERSNVDLIQQMTQMITCERAYQSAAQISKMYDQLMGRAASDVGRLA